MDNLNSVLTSVQTNYIALGALFGSVLLFLVVRSIINQWSSDDSTDDDEDALTLESYQDARDSGEVPWTDSPDLADDSDWEEYLETTDEE